MEGGISADVWWWCHSGCIIHASCIIHAPCIMTTCLCSCGSQMTLARPGSWFRNMSSPFLGKLCHLRNLDVHDLLSPVLAPSWWTNLPSPEMSSVCSGNTFFRIWEIELQVQWSHWGREWGRGESKVIYERSGRAFAFFSLSGNPGESWGPCIVEFHF